MSDTKEPVAPPSLTTMAARKDKLEADRKALFEKLKAALVEHGGCVSYAGEALGMKRARADSLVRRFGLSEWAKGLRKKTTGHAGGRQDR